MIIFLKKKLYNILFIRILYFKFFRRLRKQRDINLYLLKNYSFNCAIDVGANKGLYSLELEKISKNVIAFEPIKSLFKELCLILNKNTAIFNYALGNRNEKQIIKIPIIKNSTSYGRASISQKFKLFTTETILVRSLDHLIKKKIIKVNQLDFIKIDTEGYEFQVIKGAKETIKKYKPILLVELELRNSSIIAIKKIFSLLKKLNYDSFYSNNGIDFKKNSFDDIKNLQKNTFFKKDILTKKRYSKGDKREYICNFWFFQKDKFNKSNATLKHNNNTFKKINKYFL
jgi:FkbM family methyltransferase